MLAAPKISLKDFSNLLADVPKGAWVALSNDESRVITYAAELQQVLQKAKELGEQNPIILRVPEADAATLFL